MSVHPQLWRRSLRSPTTKVIVVIVTVLILLHSLPLRNFYIFSRERIVRINTIPDPPKHPIDQLIHEQRLRYKELLKRQSKSPEEAITSYKLRYNRSPPSGFADWVRYALQQNSTIIDDFDTIEKVLQPFRQLGLEHLKTRIESARRAGSRLQTVSIKNGTTELAGLPIMESLKDVLQSLPDMTFLLNELDEPRVIGSQPEKDDIAFHDYGRRPSWERLTASCQKTDNGELEQQQHPYFLESTKSSLDLCRNPAYHNQYGMFTSPCTFVATEGLVPVFSVARVSTMRDVLVPGHDYHNEGFLNKNDVDFRNFTSKENKLYWRGSNTGTYASLQMKWETNHRARFMLKVRNNTDLFDVGMTAYIQCDWNVCQAMEQALGLPPRADKNASFKYKFVMDMDGNGYSGRFYRLLQSNSVVFKQTLVEQWHDERVIPWVHYIPVTIGLDEIEDLVRFFSTEGARQAEEIAAESTSWVKVALRPIDMTIYEYRLLLEYAALFEKTG
ncbi:F-actin-capping protein subunit beta [Orbilia oligospora]|uniref:F-actin-capping protein subunit beta n=1 Tax=Orbilia oligospora TaxID=2813651 RepID=A0A7C8KLE9_ORBOL|nr:F-actin-capping protein subunit beta [Orbilia oligospora]